MPISLPPEREAMLLQICEQLDKAPADVIGDLILDHIERGTIADRTAGVSMAVDGTHILFSITAKSGKKIMGGFLNASDAVRLADAIDMTVRTSSARGRPSTTTLFKIEISRVGIGVSFAQGTHKRVVAASVAQDIVRQLRAATASLAR